MRVDWIVKVGSIKRKESREGEKRGEKKWKKDHARELKIFNTYHPHSRGRKTKKTGKWSEKPAEVGGGAGGQNT